MRAVAGSSVRAVAVRAHGVIGRRDHHKGTGNDWPFVLADSPDADSCFTNDGNNSIGRANTTGTVSSCTRTGINPPAP